MGGIYCYLLLRLGLVLHVALQLCQFPLRCLIYRQVSKVRSEIINVPIEIDIYSLRLAEKIRGIERTRAWKWNQKLALLVYLNSCLIFGTLLADKFFSRVKDPCQCQCFSGAISACEGLLYCHLYWVDAFAVSLRPCHWHGVLWILAFWTNLAQGRGRRDAEEAEGLYLLRG